MSEYSDAQIEDGIALALAERNVTVVPSLIALLALQNPSRAEVVRQTILFGFDLAADPMRRTSEDDTRR